MASSRKQRVALEVDKDKDTLRTRIFDLYHERYPNLSALARAMGISESQLYRVRQGMRPINEKFIVGAKRAFPGHGLDKLFYIKWG